MYLIVTSLVYGMCRRFTCIAFSPGIVFEINAYGVFVWILYLRTNFSNSFITSSDYPLQTNSFSQKLESLTCLDLNNFQAQHISMSLLFCGTKYQ